MTTVTVSFCFIVCANRTSQMLHTGLLNHFIYLFFFCMVHNSLLSVRTYNKSAKSSRDSAFTLDGSLLFFFRPNV